MPPRRCRSSSTIRNRPARSAPSVSAGAAAASTGSRRWRRTSKAAVAYYGLQVPADQVPAIRAPLLLHYAGLDQRVNAGIAAYEAALKANNKRYTIYMYDGVNHAFNNDTSNRYDKPAADLAWSRTIAFFKDNLGAPPKA